MTHLSIDEELLESHYSMAYQFFMHKRYDEARQFFRILVQLNSSKAKYWKGLGASLQLLKNYEEALNCYTTAQILNQNAPDLHLYIHAADCYLALNEIDSGLKTLKKAKRQAKKLNDQRVLNHVTFMQAQWKLKKNN